MNKVIDLYLYLFRIWLRFPEQLRYILVGGYNTVFSYALYAFFLWISGHTHPQTALFLSFLLSSFNGFWTQKIFVFATHNNWKKEYIKCLFGWGISYLLNIILLDILLYFNWDPYSAQILALILVTINSYIMLKYIAFQPIAKGEQK